jgi:hypothetical protein
VTVLSLTKRDCFTVTATKSRSVFVTITRATVCDCVVGPPPTGRGGGLPPMQNWTSDDWGVGFGQSDESFANRVNNWLASHAAGLNINMTTTVANTIMNRSSSR